MRMPYSERLAAARQHLAQAAHLLSPEHVLIASAAQHIVDELDEIIEALRHSPLAKPAGQ